VRDVFLCRGQIDFPAAHHLVQMILKLILDV
jgi:hypothetical protein